MKLASLKHGRDGRLVVVSDDLAYFADASHVVPTLQGRWRMERFDLSPQSGND